VYSLKVSLYDVIVLEFSTHFEIKWDYHSTKWAVGCWIGFIIFNAGQVNFVWVLIENYVIYYLFLVIAFIHMCVAVRK